MKKNDNRWTYFDKVWFVKNQRILLFLCNNYFFRYIFRYLLNIRRKETKLTKKIICLSSNSYIFHCKNNRYKLLARTSEKYSKKIYFKFKYYWLFLHWSDKLFSQIPVMQLNFGFDTLIISPEVGGGLTNKSCDGHAGTTFSNLRSGAGTSSSDDWGSIIIGLSTSATPESGNWIAMSRGMVCFDVSSLPSDAIMVSNTLYLCASGTSQINDFDSDPNMCIVDTLCPIYTRFINNDDYILIPLGQGVENYHNSVLDSVSWVDMTSGSNIYHEFDISNSAHTVVSGTLRYGIRSSWDIDNSPPTWIVDATCEGHFDAADTAGVEPYLEYTYDTFHPITCLI
jgi:hypothetical protein